MAFQPNPQAIEWQLHLRSAPAEVYAMLATDEGRAQFWAESAKEYEGAIDFVFPGGLTWRGEILAHTPPSHFAVRYYGGSETHFWLAEDGTGGTELRLTDIGVPSADRTEVIAGWVSVLMALKAAVDYDVDLRNHDPKRSWENGYVEN